MLSVLTLTSNKCHEKTHHNRQQWFLSLNYFSNLASYPNLILDKAFKNKMLIKSKTGLLYKSIIDGNKRVRKVTHPSVFCHEHLILLTLFQSSLLIGAFDGSWHVSPFFSGWKQENVFQYKRGGKKNGHSWKILMPPLHSKDEWHKTNRSTFRF